MERRLSARAAVIAAIATAAVILAGAALAAEAARDPLRLVLQRVDMPAGAKWTNGRMPASFARGLAAQGLRGRAAFHSTQIPLGTARYKAVDGLVVVVADAAQGRRAFRLFREDLAPRAQDTVRLPSYGDQQLATVTTRPTVKAEVLVRKGAVVWQLEVATGGTAVMTRAQALGELKKYATKQKRRIGRG